MRSIGIETRNLRREIPQGAYGKSAFVACFLFTLEYSLFLFALVVSACAESIAVKVLASTIGGLMVVSLFVIGHDACHDSFTASPRLNRVLGRLAFLPSLHPFACWELGHNRIHHRWTNLAPKDYAWAPHSKAQFDALPPVRRLLERIYRTVPGVGLNYLIEIWWRHMIFPAREDRAAMKDSERRADRMLVLVFAFVLIAAYSVVHARAHPDKSIAAVILDALLFGFLIPQAVWNWLMGFATFLQHTHERVQWFDNREEWSLAYAQLHGTVHVGFPWLFKWVVNNITEHTIHHVDPRVPLYHLPAAQAALESKHSSEVVHYPFTVGRFLKTLRTCKLYDYRRGCWTDFDGNPTTTPKVQPHPEVNDSQAASPSVANRREP